MLRTFGAAPNRWPGRLCALVFAGATVYLAIKFGPVPDPPPLQPGPGPSATRAAGVSPASTPGADIPVSQPEMLLSMFGAGRVVDAEGCESVTPDQFAARIEAAYRNAGYLPVQQTTSLPAAASSSPGRVPRTYWLSKGNAAFSIGAFTSRYRAGRVESTLEMTSAATDSTCGTRWRKYHYEVPRSGAGTVIAGGSGEDNSGQPPLPSGARHLFTLPSRSGAEMKFYSVSMAAATLRQWLRGSMSRLWFDVDPPVNRTPAGQPDLLYFTQADRYCLIYVAEKPQPDGNSFVVVSVGHR